MGTDRMTTQLTAGEIHAAILEALKQKGGCVSTLWLPNEVATVTGTAYPARTGKYDTEATQLDSRINGAAARMADAGLIVRVKKGDTLPDGSTDRHRGWLYTRERYDADLAQGQEDQEGRRRHTARMEAVRDRMTVLGLSPDGHDRLSVDDWERLLGLAERGLPGAGEGTTPALPGTRGHEQQGQGHDDS
jgi:hypothetical protein